MPPNWSPINIVWIAVACVFAIFIIWLLLHLMGIAI